MVVLLALAARDAPAADVRNLAVVSELIHATLLHDDVMMETSGGQPTASVYSNSASVLGDHLLIEALRLVQRSGSQRCRELARHDL